MHLDFSDRVVLVTGAAQGIGKAIAQAFTDSAAQVYLSDIDAVGLAETAATLDRPAYAADLGHRSEAQRVVESVLAHSGRLDILVHAAGGTCGQAGAPLETITEDNWQPIFSANLDAAMWLAQAAAPAMRRQGQGRIITISSGAGLRVSLTGIQAYAAAKHALVGLTKQLSWELAQDGITVNSVAPGFVRSNPTSEQQWQAMGDDGQQRLLESLHTRRLGTAADIAHAVVFLASDQAGWITGQILSVDGGRS